MLRLKTFICHFSGLCIIHAEATPFFTWHLNLDLILLLLNWLRNNPWCAYDLEMTETTIGRGDAPTLPPSGLWSSEKGLGRLSTHVRPCEFGGSTAGSHGERNISQETHAREQALHYFSECGSAGRKGGTALRESLRPWRYLWGHSEAILCGPGQLGLGGYPKMSANKIIYKCNKYPKRNFSHEN